MDEDEQRLLVRQTRLEADGVLSLELEDLAGNRLPKWSPGAHLEIQLESGVIRHYSLCSHPADRSRYRIAVLLEPNGRGGSREIHESVRAGTSLRYRGPRNRFELCPPITT